jgi:xylulokinase
MSFLSVDVGSSRCKAAIISAIGEVLALRSTCWAPQHPATGRAELDPELLLNVVASLVREVAQMAANDSVQAICFSSHGETLIAVGADGRPLAPAILNTDGRAVEEAMQCSQRIARQRLFTITGHTSHAMYPVPKLMWWKAHAPEIFDSARWFLGVTDFILLRLGLTPLMDFSHAARFMALDVRARAWSREVLEMAGLMTETLSAPVPAGTVAGRLGRSAAGLLGLPEGTAVVVGGHDQVIGALGMGVTGAGRAAGSLGTYECILVASDEPQLNDAAMERGLNTYPHAVAGKYVTIAYFPSGIMLEWLGGLLCEGESEGDFEALWRGLEARVSRGPSGLIVTPHIIGTCNPEFHSSATAAMTGMTLATARGDLYKGVLEGIASELALIVDCLESSGARFDHIYASGGGTRSPTGMRLRAASTQKCLHVPRVQESVCLGGAVLSSVAMGVYADVQEAVAAMVHEDACIRPDTELVRQYQSQFARYREFRPLLMQINGS